MPKRIQLKRVRGWRLPENAVSVARPSRWGNPLVIGKHVETREEAVDGYRQQLEAMAPDERADFLEPLKGKDLACYCPIGAACHGDLLLEWANREP